MTRLEDAFFRYSKKNRFGIYLFLSRDWRSSEPWTYDGQSIPYLYSKHVQDRDVGRMTTRFFGPIAVVFYKMKGKDK